MEDLESSINKMIGEFSMFNVELKSEKISIFKLKIEAINFRRKLIKEQVFTSLKNIETSGKTI